MLTVREAVALQALAEVALPAVRRREPLRRVLPCKADRFRLRAAVAQVMAADVADDRCAAVEYLARGEDPLP